MEKRWEIGKENMRCIKSRNRLTEGREHRKGKDRSRNKRRGEKYSLKKERLHEKKSNKDERVIKQSSDNEEAEEKGVSFSPRSWISKG
jgi:hypothetical protein